jgi:hypothetical protein
LELKSIEEIKHILSTIKLSSKAQLKYLGVNFDSEVLLMTNLKSHNLACETLSICLIDYNEKYA